MFVSGADIFFFLVFPVSHKYLSISFKMFKTALLVLTKPLGQIRSRIPDYLSEVNSLVTKTAYIHIQPSENQNSKFKLLNIPYTVEVRNIVKDFYKACSKTCSDIDLKVLVGHFNNSEVTVKFEKYDFRDECDVVIIDRNFVNDTSSEFLKSLSPTFNLSSGASLRSLQLESSHSEPGSKKKRPNTPEDVGIYSC